MGLIRNSEIHRRRVRKAKLAHLRARYAKAKNEGERSNILAKVKRVHPGLTREQVLAPAAKPASQA